MRMKVYGGSREFHERLRLAAGAAIREEGECPDLVLACGGKLPTDLACETLLLWEGALPQGTLQAQRVISCGFSPRNSLSVSSFSASGAVLSVQRAIPRPGGGCILPQDLPLPREWAVMSMKEQAILAGALLLLGKLE